MRQQAPNRLQTHPGRFSHAHILPSRGWRRRWKCGRDTGTESRISDIAPPTKPPKTKREGHSRNDEASVLCNSRRPVAHHAAQAREELSDLVRDLVYGPSHAVGDLLATTRSVSREHAAGFSRSRGQMSFLRTAVLSVGSNASLWMVCSPSLLVVCALLWTIISPWSHFP